MCPISVGVVGHPFRSATVPLSQRVIKTATIIIRAMAGYAISKTENTSNILT